MGPTRILLWYPCAFGFPEILIVTSKVRVIAKMAVCCRVLGLLSSGRLRVGKRVAR